jgi:taurine dioxygenase
VSIEVAPLTPVLGAVISGVVLEPGIDDATVAAIRAALLEHKVLFFREQRLDAAEMTKVASRFGEPTPAHPVEPAVEGHPEVLALDSEEGARADVWHSDLTYQERPPHGAK